MPKPQIYHYDWPSFKKEWEKSGLTKKELPKHFIEDYLQSICYIIIDMQTLQELKKQPIPTETNALESYISDLFCHIQTLETKVSILVHRKYGRSSERYVDPNQPSLFDEVEALANEPEKDEEDDIDIPPHKRKKRRGKIEIPDDIERKIIVHDLLEEGKACLCCGDLMTEIGEEKTEKLDVIPAKLAVQQDVYKKYACKNKECDGKPKQAKVEPTAVPRIKASMILYSLVITAKANGLNPFHYLKWTLKELSHIKTADDLTKLLPIKQPG